MDKEINNQLTLVSLFIPINYYLEKNISENKLEFNKEKESEVLKKYYLFKNSLIFLDKTQIYLQNQMITNKNFYPNNMLHLNEFSELIEDKFNCESEENKNNYLTNVLFSKFNNLTQNKKNTIESISSNNAQVYNRNSFKLSNIPNLLATNPEEENISNLIF